MNFQPKLAKYETLTDLFRNIQKEQLKKNSRDTPKGCFKTAKDLLDEQHSASVGSSSEKSEKVSENYISESSNNPDVRQLVDSTLNNQRTFSCDATVQDEDTSGSIISASSLNKGFKSANDLLKEQQSVSVENQKKISDFLTCSVDTNKQTMNKSNNLKSLFGESDEDGDRSPKREIGKSDKKDTSRESSSSSVRRDREKDRHRDDRDRYRDDRDRNREDRRRDRSREDRRRRDRSRDRYRDDRYRRNRSPDRRKRDSDRTEKRRRHSSERDRDDDRKRRKDDRERVDRWKDDDRDKER